MSEKIDGIKNKFLTWKEAFESNGLKVNLGETKVMVSSVITKHGLSKSKVDPCVVSSLREKANSAMCLQCGKWIHGRCAGEESVTAKLSRNIACI